MKKISVAHLTFQLGQGGAGLAVRSLHKGLNIFSSIESRMITSPLDIRNPSLNLYNECAFKALRYQYELFRRISDRILAKLIARQYAWHSYSALPSLNASIINRLPVDIVHLHWVQAGFISIDTISRIRKPLVWTLHDLWPLMGSDHVPVYRDGSLDLGNQALTRKLFSYQSYKKRLLGKTEIDFIAPSQKIAELAKRTSNYSHNHRIHVIQNCFEPEECLKGSRIEKYSTETQVKEEPTVLFGAHGFLTDKNKGWDKFSLLVDKVAAGEVAINLEIFGDSSYHPMRHPRIRSHGVVKDREKLRAIYSRATLFASFSYFETFCYAGLEAASSGASIICFDSSSLAEVVRNYKIGKVISASRCGESIVAETVEYAQRLFASPGARKAMPAELLDLVSPARIAARHEALYESLLREIAGR